MFIFGFDPIAGMFNLIALLRPMLVVAGILVAIGFMFKGKLPVALGALVLVIFMYYAVQPPILNEIGKSFAETLTITTEAQNATTTTTAQPAAQDATQTSTSAGGTDQN